MPTLIETRNSHGVLAYEFGNEISLRRLVLACFLTESATVIRDHIAALVPKVNPLAVLELAITARKDYALRKVPLLLVREMARYPSHRPYVADALEAVIERADEMGAFLEMYWEGKSKTAGRDKLARQVQVGLARAFAKFNAYSFARYDRDSAKFSMQDIIRIAHPKPSSDEQAELYRKIAKGEDLPPIVDWERELSASTDKRASWEMLLKEKKVGGLALLKNLRNMFQAGVPESVILHAIQEHSFKYVLPFRFISAMRELASAHIMPSPDFTNAVEIALLKGLADFNKLDGDTVFLVDVSGSMGSSLGMTFTDRRGRTQSSPMSRSDGARALTMMLREVCDRPHIFKFHTRIHKVPESRGFELGAYVVHERQNTRLGDCLKQAKHQMELDGITPKRLIVLTDEESQDDIGAGFAKHNYLINVKSTSYSVGYGDWVRLVGFSEHIVRLVYENEKLESIIEAHKSST